MKTTYYYIATSVLITCLLASSANSQSFWFGNPIAEFMDPNTVDAYHDFWWKMFYRFYKVPS